MAERLQAGEVGQSASGVVGVGQEDVGGPGGTCGVEAGLDILGGQSPALVFTALDLDEVGAEIGGERSEWLVASASSSLCGCL